MITRKTVFQRIIPICVLAGVLIFNVVLVVGLSHYDADQVDAHDESTYVRVGEIYQHPENIQQLYNLLNGAENTQYAQIYEHATQKRAANFFRRSNYGKEKNQNLQVTFGGLAWQVCYLSLTGKDGDAERTPILTLLLADTDQLSRFQTWSTNHDFDANYPSNLYGSSYLRAVALNNGGQYATGRATLTTAIQDPNSPWAIFTMDGVAGSVTDAIVKPSQVAWQENQSALASNVDTYNYLNEAWGVPSMADSHNGVDYQVKELNCAWKDDYLWLPSYTEVKYGSENRGIWLLNNAQLRCRNKQYWLRSVVPSQSSVGCAITTNGKLAIQNVNNGGNYVLPALHLNLGAASLQLAA